MDITSDRQLYALIRKEILTPLAKSLSEKILDEVRQFIFENAPTKSDGTKLSTVTVRKYAKYDMQETADGYLSTIYINDEGMETEETPYLYGSYSKFMSFGLKSKWDRVDGGDGMSISYHLVEWLEETGAHGSYGNNPFEAIHMFHGVYEKLETEVPKWISQYARQIGVEIVRG